MKDFRKGFLLAGLGLLVGVFGILVWGPTLNVDHQFEETKIPLSNLRGVVKANPTASPATQSNSEENSQDDHEVSGAIVPKPETQRTREEVLRLIEEDRYCELALEIATGAWRDLDTLDLLLNAKSEFQLSSDEEWELQEAFGEKGEFKGEDRAENHSLPILFFNGLAYAKLMDGLKKDQTYDLERAIDLLSQVEMLDGENAAASAFLATVMEKNSSSSEAIREKFLEASRKPIFDSYIERLGRSLMKKAYGNTSLMISAIGVLSTMPIPDFLPMKEAMTKHISSQDAEFSEQTLVFGETMMKATHEMDERPAFGFLLFLEYVIGRSLYKTAWESLYGKNSAPELKDYKEINQPSRKLANEAADAINKIKKWSERELRKQPNPSLAQTDCPRSDLDRILETFRDSLR